jgi:ABC-type nickel/cobalt efflux system permease component RcnA/ABC-type uncharacterized transport system substrate-binding protein
MKKYLIYIIFLIALAIFSSSRLVEAHPHVYVDASLTFVVDDSGLVAVRQNWLFDDIFSRAILSDLGLDEKSLATPQGQDTLKNGAFAYLANYNYFTHIESGGKQLPVKPEGFRVSLFEGRMVYDFTVPINLSFDQVKDFRIMIFDKDYYSDILLMKDNIGFEINGMAQVSHSVRPAKDHAYWKFIIPEAVHLSILNAPGTAPEMPKVEYAEEEKPGLIQVVMSKVRTFQKELTVKLNRVAVDIKGDPFGPAFWMFLGFSFIYGIIHAIGPGHGKTVVCSYFLSNPGSFFSGALMGNVITFVHMGSAVVAVGVAYAVFSSGMGGFQEASRAIQPASYALLTLMGLFLAGKATRDVFKGGMLAEPSCSIHPDDVTRSVHIKKVLIVSFVTGLIPCPGAAVILAFSIGLNIFWTGVLALILMAIGMGLTTTLFAWAAVAARGVTLNLSGKNKKLFNWVYAGLSIAGAACIALFGAALFLGSI